MKLYTFPPSPNARKVNAVVAHLGIQDIEVQLVTLPEGAHRKPEYLAINPMGKIPALVDGDLALWESNAICQYLCDRHGETTFYPKDIKVRADIARWMFWESTSWAPGTMGLTWENFAKKFFAGGEPDAAAVKIAEDKFHVAAKILNARLDGRKFVLGDNVTVADYVLGGTTTYHIPAKFPLADYPNIQNWLSNLAETEGWKQTTPKN